jgi:hypothetical protein
LKKEFGGYRDGKKTIWDFLEMKAKGVKITFVTAYDYPIAFLAEQAGMDRLLGGGQRNAIPRRETYVQYARSGTGEVKVYDLRRFNSLL